MAKFILLHLLLLWAGAGSAEIWKRLIGGGPCEDSERPHQVQIFQKVADAQSICGGTLIHEKWVLTASQCYNKAEGEVSVKAGVHPKKSSKVQEFDIKADNIHVFDESLGTGDIMLIRLPVAVSEITPAVLPDFPCQTPAIKEELRIAGYGSTGNRNGPADPHQPLQCLDMKVAACPKPKQNYFCGQLPEKPAGLMCNGDSGGGWVKKRFFRTSVIYGVLSGNFKTCEKTAIFTSVCAPRIREWINDTINKR